MNTELAWLKCRYIQVLNNLYGGEMDNTEILPEMVESAQAPALKSAFQYYLEKTRIQVWRLNQVFAQLGVWPEIYPQPQAGRPAGPAGARASRLAAFNPTDAAMTSVLRQNQRRVISGYLLALNCAEILRDRAAVDLLEQTLNEEYEADQIFAELSHPVSVAVAVG